MPEYSVLPIRQIIVEVTQACNHACVHCYNYWAGERAPVHALGALSRFDILRLVRSVQQTAAIEEVAFSGGEPLLRRDMAGMADDMVSNGLRPTVITNGRLLTDRLAQDFPPETLFELTLFSADAAVHDRIAGRSGAFSKVIEAAIAVHKRKCGLAISCVLNRMGLEGFERTLKLAIALGADGIAINRVNLTEHTRSMADRLVPSVQELSQVLMIADRMARRARTHFAVSVPIPPCIVDPAPYRHLHFGWCPRGGPGAYYTIGYTGLVRPCNHSSAVLGDLKKQSFEAIVRSRRTSAFWAPVPPECRTCQHPLRDQCRGGCLAASRECYGSGARIDPFVGVCRRQSDAATHGVRSSVQRVDKHRRRSTKTVDSKRKAPDR